ncbi:hypothetical protein MSAR_31210 [Mycolicibacterium sarraceniae]|uniref:Uncharacterized protein n=1 Tax=Mycolicibacterium sarraceniae TaxID=1534348 RepID=A0A7I7SVB6_9MYCO|nr:hypothetical protein MSAR_31210 [Mycolicibacterium sarraceniae]
MLAGKAVTDSGPPRAILRLAGAISPDATASMNGDYLVLMRTTPGDNRLHTGFASSENGLLTVPGNEAAPRWDKPPPATTPPCQTEP